MLKTYTWPRYSSPRAPEIAAAEVRRVPLAVVGAGPVGLSAAIDGALRGLPVLLLDEDNTVSVGSRGVCYAKRTLEIFDRLGVGDAVVGKGVTWNVGRTFHRDDEVFSFNLQPDPGHRRPGMVNLQQYHLEQMLVERAQSLAAIELRWQHKVSEVKTGDDGVRIEVESPEGRYTVHADWLVVADGARSPIRRSLGLDIEGKVFQDRFLIADVVLDGEPFPAERTERRFWFDPPFHPGQSALMHREADNVWRIDFQLGWDADPEAEKQPERVSRRIRQALDSQGFADIGFELEWVSIYTFQCRRMAGFRHGRLLFVGDAAHQVSPFGARGANSGVQDTDNLMWKLAAVINGRAPHTLLDSYDCERRFAADENLLNSSRSTDFMTPKSRASRVLREAVLGLAADYPLARALVNSGRLSVPALLSDSPLNTPDSDAFEGWMRPGAPLDDAPVCVPTVGGPQAGWLLPQTGRAFTLLVFGRPDSAASGALHDLDDTVADRAEVRCQVLIVMPAAERGPDDLPWIEDSHGLAAGRCDAQPGTAYLLRPDQHVAARWRRWQADDVRAAIDRALGRSPGSSPR